MSHGSATSHVARRPIVNLAALRWARTADAGRRGRGRRRTGRRGSWRDCPPPRAAAVRHLGVDRPRPRGRGAPPAGRVRARRPAGGSECGRWPDADSLGGSPCPPRAAAARRGLLAVARARCLRQFRPAPAPRARADERDSRPSCVAAVERSRELARAADLTRGLPRGRRPARGARLGSLWDARRRRTTGPGRDGHRGQRGPAARAQRRGASPGTGAPARDDARAVRIARFLTGPRSGAGAGRAGLAGRAGDQTGTSSSRPRRSKACRRRTARGARSGSTPRRRSGSGARSRWSRAASAGAGRRCG